MIKQQNAVLICSWRWIRVSLGRCDGPVLVGEGAGQDLLFSSLLLSQKWLFSRTLWHPQRKGSRQCDPGARSMHSDVTQRNNGGNKRLLSYVLLWYQGLNSGSRANVSCMRIFLGDRSKHLFYPSEGTNNRSKKLSLQSLT